MGESIRDMRRLFILLLIFATLFISGCFNELSSEDSSVLESEFVSTITSELTASKDVSEAEKNIKNITYSPIYGEYADEIFLNKKSFISILKEKGIYHYIDEESDESNCEKISYALSEKFVASAEIYNSVDEAKNNYQNSFLIKDENLKSTLIILNFESSIRIGNIIIIGNEKAVNPICDYFGISFFEKKCSYEKTFVEYTHEISVSEIETSMKEKGFTQYDSQSFNSEYYKVFVNFITNDCCSIIKCESAEKAKSKAERLSTLSSGQNLGVVYIHSGKYVFISRGDFWLNVFEGLSSLTDT